MKYLPTLLSAALLVPLTPLTVAPALAQSHTTEGVNGRNVLRVEFEGGSFRRISGGWTEYGADGKPRFRFVETHRDEWSVYLNDASRNIQLQIDIHRKWISLGTNNGAKQDQYRITKLHVFSPPKVLQTGAT